MDLMLKPSDYAALPLSVRVLDRLTDAIVLADEILDDLATQQGAAVRSIEADVRRIYDDVDALIARLAE
jgi:hypothetical protein